MSDSGQPTGSVVGDSPLAQRNPPAPTDPSAVPPTESDLDRRISERIEERLRVQRLELEEQRRRDKLQNEEQRCRDKLQHDEQRRQDKLQNEEQRRQREILQLLNNLDRLFRILCPPATYGRGSSVVPSMSGKQSTKSSGSNNSKCGKAVRINGTDHASRVLFTTTLLRSSEASPEDDLENWYMTNAHILGKAEIKRCEAQAVKNRDRYDVLCGRLHTMLGNIIEEVQSRECRNIVWMVKGFELAMDEHAFTFVPDFDADSEYAWKVHVFDKEFRVDVTTVNSGNPTNRDASEASRTTEQTVEVGPPRNATLTISHLRRSLYKLNDLDGERINFHNTVSIRCLLVRALSSFYANDELTVEFLQRLVQWTSQYVGEGFDGAAASDPKSSIQLIREWLLCLHEDERSDGFKPALVASSHTEQSLLDEA